MNNAKTYERRKKSETQIFHIFSVATSELVNSSSLASKYKYINMYIV